MAGKLVGINTAIVSRSGGSIASASPFPPPWCGWWWTRPRPARAHVLRPWLGASLQGVTAENRRIDVAGSPQRCPRGTGCRRAARLRPPALATGDIITSVDGVIISDPGGVRLSLRDQAPWRTTGHRCSEGRFLIGPVTIALTPAAQTTPADETAVTVPRR